MSDPGFPGYHDLYMDYMDAEIPWCGDGQTGTQCKGSQTPFNEIAFPPGF